MSRAAQQLQQQIAASLAWLADSHADGVPTADALRGMQVARGPQLTARQRRKVRDLVEHEGMDRSEAVELVLAEAGR